MMRSRTSISSRSANACKPNAESDVSKKHRRILIRAIKNIEPGDEINYDYGSEYFKEFLKPIGCKCDACEKKRKKKRALVRAEKLALKAKVKVKAGRKNVKPEAAKSDASRKRV